MESISTKERPTMAAALIPVGLSLWLSPPLCFGPLSLINAASSKSRSCRFSLTHLLKQSVRETVGQQLYFSCSFPQSRLAGSAQHCSLRPFRQDGPVHRRGKYVFFFSGLALTETNARVSCIRVLYTNSRPGQFLTHAQSRITKVVAVMKSCSPLLGLRCSKALSCRGKYKALL